MTRILHPLFTAIDLAIIKDSTEHKDTEFHMENPMQNAQKKLIPLFLIVSLISGGGVALAADSKENNLHVGGGIAMPSTTTAVFTNPAGLVGASTAGVLQAGAREVWENGTYRAGVQTGSPLFGVAAGLEHIDLPRDDANFLYYGAAVGVPILSFGLNAATGITNADGTRVNAGVLFNPGPLGKFGLTARGLDDGVDEWGLGGAFDIAPGIALVLDLASDSDFDGIEAKPGIKVGVSPIALTLSYGTGSREQFADDLTFGGSFQFSSANTLEFQYNAGGDLSKYFLAASFGF